MVCRYFREVLDWTDGVEFQCVASQNRMCGRIDGATLHSWGEVPIDVAKIGANAKKKSKQTGAAEMYNKTVSQR